MPAPVRATLESLITLEVHNVSAIEELIGANVDAINSEIWTQHMRYYSDNGVVFVKCGTSFVEYQNEFLGNYRNLAITPQTHRMYSAIEKAKFGKKYTFIAGPAGSGKTETTKDFANGIGIAAYVTNCSDRHSVDDITHVIKGAVTGGFWSIFDEFNRVAVEVLQPVTDFLTQLYQAKESG
jgi:dynein heavy chain